MRHCTGRAEWGRETVDVDRRAAGSAPLACLVGVDRGVCWMAPEFGERGGVSRIKSVRGKVGEWGAGSTHGAGGLLLACIPARAEFSRARGGPPSAMRGGALKEPLLTIKTEQVNIKHKTTIKVNSNDKHTHSPTA